MQQWVVEIQCDCASVLVKENIHLKDRQKYASRSSGFGLAHFLLIIIFIFCNFYCPLNDFACFFLFFYSENYTRAYHAISLIFNGRNEFTKLFETLRYVQLVLGLSLADTFEAKVLQCFGERSLGLRQIFRNANTHNYTSIIEIAARHTTCDSQIE